MLIEPQYFIIDFDSTIITVEALDELAKIALKNNPNKGKLLQKISILTKRGMDGSISFPLSLEQRLKLFSATRKDIEELITTLKRSITPSFERNKQFFSFYSKQIYIISGGFIEYIAPVITSLGLLETNILGNEFTFNKKGEITGYEKNNILSQDMGKSKAIKHLHLKGEIIVLGDGYTDYQIRENGEANAFFAFTENITRSAVVKKADKIIANFDEFLYHFNFPRTLSYPKSKIKVLLTENIHKTAIESFENEGYQVETLASSLSENELMRKIEDVSVLGIRSKTEVTKNVLEHGKKLLAIGAFCIGTNQIDLINAAHKGVCVFNAPYSNTRSVVELVMGEIILLYRKAFDKSVNLHKGIWDKSAKDCYEVRGKKLGIIGYGNIGTQLSVVAESFGMQVYFYDIEDTLALGNAVKCATLADLLKVADVITVHVDGRKSNSNLIGEKEFALMQDGVIFLNLSRGSIVDIDTLGKYIIKKKVAGAAIDVFPSEPRSNSEPFLSKLQGLSNVILTPHIGGSTEEAQKNIGSFVSNKIISFINTGNTTLSVNFPNLTLPNQLKVHRLIHMHNNKPGILAIINKILADHKINIEGQYLKTNEEMGYVISDINGAYDTIVIDALRNISGTIRVRILY